MDYNSIILGVIWFVAYSGRYDGLGDRVNDIFDVVLEKDVISWRFGWQGSNIIM